MSRLGKLPIAIPAGVEVKVSDKEISVKGPKGELKQAIHPLIKVEMVDNQLLVTASLEVKEGKALWGLFRGLINNMVVGVSTGFTRKLEINGVGYRAAVAGKVINFNLGYSHPIVFPLPDGISAVIEANVITLSGFDKILLGDTAYKIRALRKPEPYKGKGIKYSEEVIRRKAGKAATKGK
jgi:large subunit ribosomal protein L6